MRILLVNNHEHIGGGSERVYQGTASLLEAFGHEVATLSCGDPPPANPARHSVLLSPNDYFNRGAPLQTIRNLARYVYWPRAARELDELIVKFRPDAVHLHIFYGQLSSSILPVLRRRDVRTVMTVHEYRMLCPVSTLYTPKLGICERCAAGDYTHAVRNRCNRNSLGTSSISAIESGIRDLFFNYTEYIDHFLMVSQFCKEKHIQHRPELARVSSVLHNFVEVRAAPKAPRNAPRKILYAGRLAPEKGLRLLCLTVMTRRDVILEIAGSGPLALELKTEFGDCPSISFLGKLEASELHGRMQNAWSTVAPSEWFENNPMSILESLASGTPVIGARIGGIPELIDDGKTGWLFDPSDAAALSAAIDRALATSSEHRLEMGRAAQMHVEKHHSSQSHLARLLMAYTGETAA